MKSKIHYANESWSVSICGATIPVEQMTWRFADVTCGSCLRNRIYKRDLDTHQKLGIVVTTYTMEKTNESW